MTHPAHLLGTPRWYALRTRARQEKTTHRWLARAGVETFAATAPVEREWADRVRTVEMPLFPGYIFVRIALDAVTDVLRAPGAVALVRMRGVPVPVRDEEMEAVRHLVRGVAETGAMPEDEAASERDARATGKTAARATGKTAAREDRPGGPAVGTRVRVVRGPFAGFEGTLVRRDGSSRVALRLDALRQVKSVEIDPEHLTSLEPA